MLPKSTQVLPRLQTRNHALIPKREGLKTHSTWTDFNKPRRPCFPNLPHTYRPPISLTLELPADSFAYPLQFEDVQTQQHGKPHNIHLLSCSFTLMPSEEILSSHCRLCTFPERMSIAFHQNVHKTPDPVLFSLPPSLSRIPLQ
jgi:hypothetical protein